MKISGFTIVKNATKLYYPIKESIASILPIVDEFIVALGDCDDDDHTEQEILSLQNDKIKIIRTVWDIKKFPGGTEAAHQTDLAKEACSGDWLFYIQADEVLHEKYLHIIKDACSKYNTNSKVEGLIFDYIHFFGDYDHHNEYHGWYQHEIRIIRNLPQIHSFGDAQSFRYFNNFSGEAAEYFDKKISRKINVKNCGAKIFHYGWVRPPELMQTKYQVMDEIYFGENNSNHPTKTIERGFDYGNLSNLSLFRDSHPIVMKERINQFHWKNQLHYEKNYKVKRQKMKHEILKYKVLTYIEKKIFGGRQIFTFQNWKLV